MARRWMTKPKIKEAEQFFEDGPLPFRDERACCLGTIDGGFDARSVWYVVTAHGQMTPIANGDYIVREPDGRGFYPCKPDIWEASHDEIK